MVKDRERECLHEIAKPQQEREPTNAVTDDKLNNGAAGETAVSPARRAIYDVSSLVCANPDGTDRRVPLNRYHGARDPRTGLCKVVLPAEYESALLAAEREERAAQPLHVPMYTDEERQAMAVKVRMFYDHVAPLKSDDDIEQLLRRYAPPDGYRILWEELYAKYVFSQHLDDDDDDNSEETRSFAFSTHTTNELR